MAGKLAGVIRAPAEDGFKQDNAGHLSINAALNQLCRFYFRSKTMSTAEMPSDAEEARKAAEIAENHAREAEAHAREAEANALEAEARAREDAANRGDDEVVLVVVENR